MLTPLDVDILGMPRKHAGIKHLRQSIKSRAKNLKVLGGVELLVRGLKKAATAKDTAKIKELYRQVAKAADKARVYGVITKNKAARIKSRASRFIAATK